jgi:hypothetical protein
MDTTSSRKEVVLLKWLLLAAAILHIVSTSDDVVHIEIQPKIKGEEKHRLPEPTKDFGEQQRHNYGKYEVPPTLEAIFELQKQYRGSDVFSNAVGLYFSDAGVRYFNTPSDVVVFASNGMDGIHYGFLTDYGTISNLEEAPIVCVSPMDHDQPTKLVAANLREFVRMHLTDEALFYNSFPSEEAYEQAKRSWAEESMNSPYQPTEEQRQKREQERQQVLAELMERIPLPAIDHPYRHIEQLRAERQKRISLPTQDGLGVTMPVEPGQEYVMFPVDKQNRLNIAALKTYLAEAPPAYKLALFRDIQLHHVLPQERELQAVILAELRTMGLTDEADRMDEQY